jgi:hypothetical protein
MPQCSAICKNGGACHHKAKTGHTTCGKHITQGKLVKVRRCRHVMGSGDRCTKTCEEGQYCPRHEAVRARQARKRLFQEMWVAVCHQMWQVREPHTAFVLLQEQLDTLDATEDEIGDAFAKFEAEMDWFRTEMMALAPPVAPKGELQAFVEDGQNVHTGVAVKMTNDGLSVLTDTPLAVGQDTVGELKAAWAKHPVKERKAVFKDIDRWYTQSECRVPGDWLYKRALDGLWVRIQMSPHAEDLRQRLWEECVDSRQMCCEGHLSRLCNVLVGYDETMKTPVSPGELLQQRIAAIAGEDISLPHKVVKAWEVMEELQIPREQRMDWVEAF